MKIGLLAIVAVVGMTSSAFAQNRGSTQCEVTSQEGKIKKRDRVIDRSGNWGTVIEVLQDNIASILFDIDKFYGRPGNYKILTRSTSELGKGLSCVMGLCERHRVLSKEMGTGEVAEVFTNSIAKVTFFDGNREYYKNIPISELEDLDADL